MAFKKTAEKPSRLGRLSPQRFRLLRNIFVPVLLLLPIVGFAEYFFVFSGDAEPVTVVKTFEMQPDVFVIEGIAEIVVEGTRRASEGALVTVWSDAAGNVSSNRGWVATTNAEGRFRLSLDLPAEEDFVEVHVAITSTMLRRGSSVQSVDREAKTQLSDHIIRNGSPLQVRAIFF